MATPAGTAPQVSPEEYERLRTDVGLLDRSDRGRLELTGAEAAEFLQGQVTNDVQGLGPWEGCYAALLNHKGKLRADLRVLRGEDSIWLDCERAALPVLAHTVRVYSLGRAVRSADRTETHALLSLIGPAARAALDVAPPEAEHAWVEGRLGRYVATDLGVDVICPAAEAGAVIAALGVEPVSEASAECVRIESGRPRIGRDMGSDNLPEEAGLNERAVSFTKGCYVGQETVARLHYKGRPNRRLRGLRSDEPLTMGDPVVLGERSVGTVGSATVSPELGAIALAILRREAEPGESVRVGGAGTPAEVVTLPFRDGR